MWLMAANQSSLVGNFSACSPVYPGIFSFSIFTCLCRLIQKLSHAESQYSVFSKIPSYSWADLLLNSFNCLHKMAMKLKVSVTQSYPIIWTVACQAPLSWNSLSKNTFLQASHHFLLQGIFATQGSNLCLPHCRQILYCLSHQGSLQNDYIMIGINVRRRKTSVTL